MPDSTYLPTEVVVYIVHTIYDSYDDRFVLQKRQSTLYSCCLVSRQWYSAAVSFLYKRPLLTAGNSFAQFTSTVCPPHAARQKIKVDLGSLVQYLDLSHLVHHSSNSVTARLLNRTQSSLEVFIAPRLSFSVNGLPALSKCVKLRYLDLSLVKLPKLDFASFKKAISHLRELSVLCLPQKIEVTSTDESAGTWPSKLHTINLSGVFDLEAMKRFSWPPALVNLAFRNCPGLNTKIVHHVLASPQLQSLQRLEIHPSPDAFLDKEPSDILWALPNLTLFQAPLDIVEAFLLIPSQLGYPPLPLKALELTTAYVVHDPRVVDWVAKQLISLLRSHLANLCALGISHSHTKQLSYEDHGIIDELLWEHIDEQPDDYLDGLDDIGFYVIDK